MDSLAEGDAAPLFELPSDTGGTFRLADCAGGPVVAFFYPKDDTSACTDEAIDFTSLQPEFDRLGASVVGISPDSLKRHANFKRKRGLSVELLSDPEHHTLVTYGVWGEKSMFGRKYMGVKRTTFLIGGDGRILRIWHDVRVPGHAQQVLDAVRDAGERSGTV